MKKVLFGKGGNEPHHSSGYDRSSAIFVNILDMFRFGVDDKTLRSDQEKGTTLHPTLVLNFVESRGKMRAKFSALFGKIRVLLCPFFF